MRHNGLSPTIFLSYRREDTLDLAKALAARLSDDLGSRQVFRDEDDMIAGEPWAATLRIKIMNADAALILVGPHWVGRRADGSRRIEDPDDPVRAEVRHALDRRATCTAMPVLVDRDSPPGALPADVGKLFDYHAVVATRRELLRRASVAYQSILVGAWDVLRRRIPAAVLVIGDGDLLAEVDRFVEALRETASIDARRLSRFAAGACIVSVRRRRRMARRWPDVFVVAGDDDPSETLRARILALLRHPGFRTVELVGGAAAAVLASLESADTAGDTSITSSTTAEPITRGTSRTLGAWRAPAALAAKAISAVAAIALTAFAVNAILDRDIQPQPPTPPTASAAAAQPSDSPDVGNGGVRPIVLTAPGGSTVRYPFRPTTEEVFIPFMLPPSADCSRILWEVEGLGTLQQGNACPGPDAYTPGPRRVTTTPGAEHSITVDSEGRADVTLNIWPVPSVTTAALGALGVRPTEVEGLITPGAAHRYEFTAGKGRISVRFDSPITSEFRCIDIDWAADGPGGPWSGTSCFLIRPDLGGFTAPVDGDFSITLVSSLPEPQDYTLCIALDRGCY